MTGLITAAVAGVASVGVGIAGEVQSSNAAGKQLGVENTQLGMEQQLFGEQQGYADQLNKLMADPSSVTSLPGYQFNLDQGAETTARQFAANPGSGAEGAALTQYGQNYASSAYTQQAQLLASLSGLNQNPAALGGAANTAGANGISGSATSFNQLQQLLAQSGGLVGKFGSGGSFGGAGTPATMPTVTGEAGGVGF